MKTGQHFSTVVTSWLRFEQIYLCNTEKVHFPVILDIEISGILSLSHFHLKSGFIQSQGKSPKKGSFCSRQNYHYWTISDKESPHITNREEV